MKPRAGMFVYAFTFMLGILVVQQLSVLPDNVGKVLLACVACVLLSVFYMLIKYHAYKQYIALGFIFIILILLGFVYAFFYAELALNKRLDEASTGRDILITGLIAGIPKAGDKVQSFEFEVDAFRFLDEADRQKAGYRGPVSSSDNINSVQIHPGKTHFEAEKSNADTMRPVVDGQVLLNMALPSKADPGHDISDQAISDQAHNFPDKLRLNWYYGDKVTAGERWQFLVRLKPPHGFMNPGGFDYEGWLFQQGIHATGYVRTSDFTQRLQTASEWGVDLRRQLISAQIDRLGSTDTESVFKTLYALTDNESFSLLKALAVGDKSSISPAQWKVLSATGTSHLMAISGLHIGLASLFGYLLVRRLIPSSLMKHVPAQHIALLAGFIVALCYALLAGFSIPTQRAIIMLFAITFIMLLRRQTRPVDTLGFALLLVLLADPLAVMAAGFWFSFSAVAVIFISMTRPLSNDAGAVSALQTEDLGWRQRLLFISGQWLRLQLIISLFMLPLSLYMFQQGSLVSPLANLILIPYVSFLVVPVVLMGIIVSFLSVDGAQLLFILALSLLDAIWPLLSYLSELPYAVWVNGEVSLFDALLSSIALCLLYFSRRLSATFIDSFGLTLKHGAYNLVLFGLCLLSLLLLLPLFLTSRPGFASGDFQLTVLDVGQGSSAVIRTKGHTAVFDAGAKFSDKLNVGSSVVIPYLRTQGISRLDRLIISHGDADHIGGAQDILDAYPQTILIGQDIESLDAGALAAHRVFCREGLGWIWDDVSFVFLSPNEDSLALYGQRRNNRSCVLQISSASGSVLLSGDIEQDIERQLVKNYGERLASDVLVVPHHGSNTSSSQPFISLVNPKISIISAGYKNRYRLPSAHVLKRYEQLDTTILNTSDSGAVTLDFKAVNGAEVVFERYRPAAGRYWNHQLKKQ